ncbi:hypothetical protein ABI_17320 [Asticcacaulis biprosthecium C19]|uniref:TfoX N-terminal domain-containing protein n=1 Tax=Asticcacaulis biprosthecium C19 TaxID=715226 RepID=F4QKB4_9CAUL|nr:hypothetical protein [Asticcacaulis biprosthecium]EGF93292.1 hypothetical protein ABI_17320 [Asticcacaulis biprosthecium C19]
MAYSDVTAMKVRDALGAVDISEKQMMGGLVFLINGNMTVSIKTLKTGVEQFMFRPGKDREDEALTIPGTRPMIHGGRRMTGFLFIDADDCDDVAFTQLLTMSRGFALLLPPK